MSAVVIHGRRRFTCLSPTLVRMEFAPNGVFEDRRSIVAAAGAPATPFTEVREDGDTLVLDTGRLTLRSREPDKDFFPANLEARWVQDDLLQFWRPGDRDHRNLGGTVRSLDCFNRSSRLTGVHTADAESPDTKAMEWLSWLLCETDPEYLKASPRANAAGRRDYQYAAQYNPREMLHRSVNATLDQQAFGPGILSRSGYFFLNDSTTAVYGPSGFPVERERPGCRDWYLFVYGDDYAAALADFVRLSGRAPLPTRNAFGIFFSRWPAYDETEAKAIVNRFAADGFPLSVLVLDMEWHLPGWCHWDWNGDWYPDPAAFCQWCHDRNVAVTLNTHPLRVRDDDSHFAPFVEAAGLADAVTPLTYAGKDLRKVDVNIGDERQARAFMRVCHDPIVDQGVDFWWVDGSKGTLNGANDQLVTNQVHFENVARPGRRGMLLSRYGGLGSHRYGVFFTGDTESCWSILATQCEFNIRAGQVGMAYVSHDIGGFHTGTKAPGMDPELYLRWLQFGVFNPVLRFHSSPSSGSRQPWDYGERIAQSARRWLRLRNALVPYLYTAARTHHDTGMPIVRGLYLADSTDDRAYRFDEFYFGPDILVAPMVTPAADREVYLPPGDWYELGTATRHAGDRTFTVRPALEDIPVYVRAGAVLPLQESTTPMQSHVRELTLEVYPGAAGAADLYEDDGRTPAYETGACCRTRFRQTTTADGLTLTGEVVAGAPLGETRTITVVLLAEREPVATLDGAALAAEAAGAGRWVVRLPERPAAAPFTLTVATGNSAAAE